MRDVVGLLTIIFTISAVIWLAFISLKGICLGRASMLKTVLYLEFLKHRKTFVSIVLVAFLGVATASLISVLTGRWKLQEALVGSSAFLILCLPFLAVLFGAQPALSLRRETEKTREEQLPVAPLVRVFAAYLVSLVYYAVDGCLIFQFMAYAPVYEAVYVWLHGIIHSYWPIVMLLYIHFLAFAFTYCTKLPLLGGGMALIVAGVQGFLHNVIFSASDWFLSSHYGYSFWILPSLLGAWLIGLAGLALVIERIERGSKVGYARGVLLSLCLLSGIAGSLGMVQSIASEANKELYPYGYSFWQVYWDSMARTLPVPL